MPCQIIIITSDDKSVFTCITMKYQHGGVCEEDEKRQIKSHVVLKRQGVYSNLDVTQHPRSFCRLALLPNTTGKQWRKGVYDTQHDGQIS